MWDYAVRDAELTWRLWDLLKQMPQWKELPEEIWPHKQDLVRALLSMKRHGVHIDVQLAQKYVQLGEEHMARIEKSLGINPASPKQMKKLLIDDLGLPVVKSSVKNGGT